MKIENLISQTKYPGLVWYKFNPNINTAKGLQVVYVFSIRDNITYIGTSGCLKTRLMSNQHRTRNTAIYYIVVTDKRLRLDIEKFFIKEAKTKLNLNVGRKKIDPKKKKVPILIMVPGKFKFRAQAECNLVEAKYSS